jgi:dihydrofolate synthase/folylpolyglutamate synthase
LPPCGLTSDLRGIYQKQNIQTAYTALQLLPESIRPSQQQIENGFLHAAKNTGLRGRWEVLQTNPKVVCDTGHNEDGIRMVLNQIAKEPYNKLHIVWGMVNDKDVKKVMDMLPKEAQYYFCQPSIPRALDVNLLHNAAREASLIGNAYKTVEEAKDAALRYAKEEDFIFIGGSTFVVADAIQ